MTASAILVPGALIILFVVAWMLFGLIDSTRDDKKIRDAFLAQTPNQHRVPLPAELDGPSSSLASQRSSGRP